MSAAKLAAPLLMAALWACQAQEEPKSVDYWIEHRVEAQEMGQACMLSGGKDINCANVGIAGARRSAAATDASTRARNEARRAARGE